jgi:hypothetical protein
MAMEDVNVMCSAVDQVRHVIIERDLNVAEMVGLVCQIISDFKMALILTKTPKSKEFMEVVKNSAEKAVKELEEVA